MARRLQGVTIKHVAADAGVSLQTVSRVINTEPNVRPAMQARVQASIDKLGYVPSIAAQRMSGSKSYLILAINDRDRTIAELRHRAIPLACYQPTFIIGTGQAANRHRASSTRLSFRSARTCW